MDTPAAWEPGVMVPLLTDHRLGYWLEEKTEVKTKSCSESIPDDYITTSYTFSGKFREGRRLPIVELAHSTVKTEALVLLDDDRGLFHSTPPWQT